MPRKTVLWTWLAAALVLTGCESAFTPDAGQATAPATTTAPAAMPSTPPAARGRGAGSTVPNSLESAMNEMNRMLQDLKRVAADPAQSEEALKDCVTFERDVAICKLLVPSEIGTMTGDAKTGALTSYRAMMTGLTKTALDLEDAINDKKPDDVKKALAQLEEIEKQGHAELKVGQD